MKKASNPPKGPRGASTSSRPSIASRGGIQKRGRASQSPRVDRDGDLAMDAETSKGRSGKGRLDSPKPSNGLASRASGLSSSVRSDSRLSTSRAQAAIQRGLEGKQANFKHSRTTNKPTASLQVHGLAQSKAASNSDGGLKNLLDFLERKAATKATHKHPIQIKKSQLKSDSTVIITASTDDIAAIQLLEGFIFAGAPLSFKLEEGSAEKPNTIETKERLRSILAGRYNAELKLLDLSNLGSDPGLNEMGIFKESKTTSKIFPALMAVCDGLFENRKAKIEAVESVTLADNGLMTISDVIDLASTFPDLKNLDLSRNSLANLASLDAWKHKFKQLENVVLTGNPIEQDLVSIKDDFLSRYPNLQIINGVQVRTQLDIIAAKELRKMIPPPIPIGPPSFRDVGQVGENFIRHFLPAYDSDRRSLAVTYYDADSRVSISVNKIAPRDSKGVSGPIPSWEPYTQYSRNLTKITHLPPRMKRLHRGLNSTQELWSALPVTRHPDLQTEAHKYLIECSPVSGLADPSGAIPGGVDGLMLTVHGEFEEPNPTPDVPIEKAMRSFSRTFILGPGKPGANPIRVVSDVMVLRPWSPVATPSTAPPTAAALPVVPTPQTPTSNSAPTDQQRQQALALQLMERTGMTLQYAALCLTETGWDLEQAFIAFTASREKLPAEAFVAQ